MALVAFVASCTTVPHAPPVHEGTPAVKITLGVPGTPSRAVMVRSGSMIAVEICCPPLELCDASGKVLRELEYTQEPQPLVVSPGDYLIVGHDPFGEKCVARIEVTR